MSKSDNTATDNQDGRKMNPKSLANLDPKARYMGKKRYNLSLMPDTMDWLKNGGNASQRIEDLVNAAKSGELKPNTAIAQTSDNTDNLKKQIKDLERQVDELTKANLGMIDEEIVNYIQDEIKAILDKSKREIKGYKRNSFTQGLKDLEKLLIDLS